MMHPDHLSVLSCELGQLFLCRREQIKRRSALPGRLKTLRHQGDFQLGAQTRDQRPLLQPTFGAEWVVKDQGK